MKKIYSLLLLGGLLLLGAQNAWALKGGETIYFQVPGSWQDASAKFSAYFFNANDGVDEFSAFATQLNGSKIYYATVPAEENGDWTKVIIARTNPANATPDFSWGQSGDITIGTGNFVYGFDYSGTGGGAPAWYTLISYSIQFNNSASWTSVKAYTYHGDVTPDLSTYSWPGAAMSNGGSGALYGLTFYAVQGSNVVIDNGDVTPGDGTQTFDEPLGNYTYSLTTKDDGTKKYNVSITKTITPTADGYATFYDPINKFYVDGSSVSVYTGTYNNSESVLKLHELLTHPSIIPANTPVVLKASSSSNFDVTLSYADAGTVDGTNNLHGTSEAISKPANSYVLGYQASTTAFYAFTGTTIPANKAYLVISGGAALAGGIRIVEGENDATNIEAVNASEEAVKFFQNGKLFIKKNGVVYDMMGTIVK